MFTQNFLTSLSWLILEIDLRIVENSGCGVKLNSWCEMLGSRLSSRECVITFPHSIQELINPWNPLQQFSYSSYCSLYISYDADKRNFFNGQEPPSLVIISFILMTLMFDSGMILWGEIRCQSSVGVINDNNYGVHCCKVILINPQNLKRNQLLISLCSSTAESFIC